MDRFIHFGRSFYVLSGASRRVDNGGHLITSSTDRLLNVRAGLDYVVPSLLRSGVFWTKWERNCVDATGDSALHFCPGVLIKLPNEDKLGFRMLQNELSSLRRHYWVQ